ncbi:hypothetical protein [Nocardia sp. NPDC058705]|uniref:hypothetical protein n=1 Tax=Nocardia sp. NPDC058705 TaxID=3346609 RepID=UPI0036A487FC
MNGLRFASTAVVRPSWDGKLRNDSRSSRARFPGGGLVMLGGLGLLVGVEFGPNGWWVLGELGGVGLVPSVCC